MPPESLPEFTYFQDPVGVGVVEKSQATCICCGVARGYIYKGPVYSHEELTQRLCPWCIADGSAASKFNAEFVDDHGVGDGGQWDSVSPEALDEITHRTPCFIAWQPERWWTHCGDGAVFINHASGEDLAQYGEHLISVMRENGPVDDEQWGEILDAMKTNGRVMSYVFQCRWCGQYGGYWDCD